MDNSRLPLLIEPEQLLAEKDRSDVIVVDLCKASMYIQSHVPGAIHIEYSNIVSSRPPVMGLVPDTDQLTTLMSQTGIKPEDTLIVYDDEGGGKAARFIYTLDIIGHKNYSLLNGGLHAWANEGYPLDSTPHQKPATNYTVNNIDNTPVATSDYILKHLENRDVQIIDSRSPAEFDGSKKFAEKAGHIPGAINIDWVNFMDPQKNLRLKSRNEITAMLEELKISSTKPTIVYCQTHHRSALTYFALKINGFENIKGYPGSWSEWGNSPDTPVETSHN